MVPWGTIAKTGPGTRESACRVRIALVALMFFLLGCAGMPEASCPAGLAPKTQAELFFGLTIPSGGEVSEAEWQRFADDEITPRFPAGLTIEEAQGQWKNGSGIVRERAKHLVIVLAGSSGDTAKLEAVRAAYKSRFRQDSVLLVANRVCASF